MKHKPMCYLFTLLLVVGAINWGLIGLGYFTGNNLNLVNMLLGAWPMVESIVYLLVGVSGLMFGAMFLKCGDSCPCNKK